MMRLAMVLALLGLGPGAFAAATPQETQALDPARRSFALGIYQDAEPRLGQFVRDYPASEHVAEAVLLQAQARYQLGQYSPAVEVLEKHLPAAGKWADQYQYWIAEARLAQDQYGPAAEAYGRLLSGQAESPLALEAAYKQAFANFQAGQPARVAWLLSESEGAFSRLSRGRTNNLWSIRGHLLLIESLLELKELERAEKQLRALDQMALAEDQRWRAQYLLAQTQLQNGQLEQAARQATNLLQRAGSAGPPEFRARAHALQGTVLEALGQPDQAISAYTNNLQTSAPIEFQREALHRIVALQIGQGRLEAAIQLLETFRGEHPQDPALDLVHLTLGELRLRRYFEAGAAEGTGTRTNLLRQAREDLDRLLAMSPESQWKGKAQYHRGWCLWEEGNFSESETAFQAAVESFEPSLDRARARFKVADAQFRQQKYSEAIATYRQILELNADRAEVKDQLFDQALYQIIQASVEASDVAAAADALAKILEWYPDSLFAPRAMLVLGHGFRRIGNPGEARALFEKLVEKFADAPLRAEAELAIGRTFVQEENWSGAAQQYDRWTAQFTNHPALAQAEFDRGWVHYRAGNETNAFQVFTNFLARFANDRQAPHAMKWVGDFYLRTGDFRNAEASYQKLFQNTNWPPSDLTYQAYLLAGQAAIAKQRYEEARKDYFFPLISRPSSPESVVAEAYYAVGDSWTLDPVVPGGTNALDRFRTAIDYFAQIPRLFPTNRLAPLALARMADCHFQLASQQPVNYDEAARYYLEVIAHPAAEIGARSQAAVGLALVLERQAAEKKAPELMEQALSSCLSVFNGSNRRTNEVNSPFWVAKAGLEAARLADALELRPQAAAVYQRLRENFPALRASIDRKLEELNRKK